MVLWRVELTNKEVFLENEILGKLENPLNVTPWLLLLSYCESNELGIKSLSLWDNVRGIRVDSPLSLSSLIPDKIDYRTKSVATGLGMSSNSEKYYGIVMMKGSTNFCVWYNDVKGVVTTTIE
jgi:hypothetical protein